MLRALAEHEEVLSAEGKQMNDIITFERAQSMGYNIGLTQHKQGRYMVSGIRYCRSKGATPCLWANEESFGKAKEAFQEWKEKRDSKKVRRKQ